jgi:hypothetical protein
VASADAATVVLGIDREDFLARPRYLPDDELRLAVYESLRTLGVLRYTTMRLTPFKAIEVEVGNGVVRLSGHVASELHRHEAVRRVAATPGVRRVEDRLVSDDQLVDAVAQAMLPHRELQPSRVKVSATLGHVVLEGDLDSPRDVELAVSVAAAVPGVASVENRLRAREEQPVPAPSEPSPEPKLLLVEPVEEHPPWRYAGERRVPLPPPANEPGGRAPGGSP